MKNNQIVKTVEQNKSGPVESEKAVRWLLADYGGKKIVEKVSFEPGMNGGRRLHSLKSADYLRRRRRRHDDDDDDKSTKTHRHWTKTGLGRSCDEVSATDAGRY